MKKPEGYEDDLGSYEIVAYDAYCGEPVAWGFKILNRLGEERFNALRKFGALEVVRRDPPMYVWALIAKRLSKEEAIKKYGSITDEERGPRGGFKSDTYGTTQFCHKLHSKEDLS